MALLLQEQDDGICPFKVKDHRETNVADPGWLKNQDPEPGSRSGMNYPDHIFRELRNKFWFKILKFYDAYPGSGINILDPQV